jgi:hypothetical protein
LKGNVTTVVPTCTDVQAAHCQQIAALRGHGRGEGKKGGVVALGCLVCMYSRRTGIAAATDLLIGT